jgi:bifunctional DNase/RNase
MSSMIQVKVDQLFLSNVGFAVLLRSENDERVLPIMIGAAEAQAIALCINEVEVPRPLTHDLFKSVIEELGATLKRTEVCGLKEGTFYARLVLDSRGVETDVDSRPSDAIAMALRFNAPIFVSEAVMNEAGRVISAEELSGGAIAGAGKEAGGKPRAKAGKKPTRREELHSLMQKAIAEERYEECARLRDEIAHIESPDDRRH